VDAILSAKPTDEIAQEIPDEELDRDLGSGYGIFAGSSVRSAVLRFSSRAARWVAEERWHIDQIGHFEPEGTYLLRLPYSHSQELIRDILRYGQEVQVIEPEELARELKEILVATLQKYSC
jgi:predicted DNA-binding transcriptional regulator YafY